MTFEEPTKPRKQSVKRSPARKSRPSVSMAMKSARLTGFGAIVALLTYLSTSGLVPDQVRQIICFPTGSGGGLSAPFQKG